MSLAYNSAGGIKWGLGFPTEVTCSAGSWGLTTADKDPRLKGALTNPYHTSLSMFTQCAEAARRDGQLQLRRG